MASNPSNLPPGVTESMIPGNRPEDIEWDQLWEKINDEAVDRNLTVEQVRMIWAIGLSMMPEIEKLVADELARLNEWPEDCQD